MIRVFNVRWKHDGVDLVYRTEANRNLKYEEKKKVV